MQTRVWLRQQFATLPSFDCIASDDVRASTWQYERVGKKCTAEFQQATRKTTYNQSVPRVVNELYKWSIRCNTTSPMGKPLDWPNPISDSEWPVIDARAQYTIESSQSEQWIFNRQHTTYSSDIPLSKSTVTQLSCSSANNATRNCSSVAEWQAHSLPSNWPR